MGKQCGNCDFWEKLSQECRHSLNPNQCETAYETDFCDGWEPKNKIAVLVDLRTNNGNVLAIEDDNDNIALFPDSKSAYECAAEHPLCQSFPYVVIDFDEMDLV